MPYFAASGLVKPCLAPGYEITSNRPPAACISRLNASTCSGGTNGSAPPVSTSTRALTFPGCAGVFVASAPLAAVRSEEHTSELQSPCNLVCRLLLEKKKKTKTNAKATNPYTPTCAPTTYA